MSDRKRFEQDQRKIETQRAQYAHLALKHDALEREVESLRARLRVVEQLADEYAELGHLMSPRHVAGRLRRILKEEAQS